MNKLLYNAEGGAGPVLDRRPAPCACTLALATVPFQKADFGRIPTPREGLMRGTMFPELYLPFSGCGR